MFGHSHQHGVSCNHGALQIHPKSPPQTVEARTPLEELFYFVKTNNLAKCQEIIEKYGQHNLIDQRDAQGHTLAHWAAQRGSCDLLEYLNQVGAPLNLPSLDTVKLHPIHWACSSGNLIALKTLVRLGVDINTADDTKHRTPLLIAAQNGFPLLVMYCVKRGADINLLDIDQDSAIHWAAYKGATEIVSVFQYLGLSTDAPDKFGQTPLHLAAMRGELGTVQYLVEELDSRALNIVDTQGRTPQQLALVKGFTHVSSYLMTRQKRQKWNVFMRWEASRAPYFIVLAMIPITLLFYTQLVMPTMPELRKLYVVHLVWNFMTFVFFFLTKQTPPGDLSQQTVYKTEYTQVTEELVNGNTDGRNDTAICLLERPLCHTCHIQRPLRAKHCRVCKICIDTFDHHCPFVDNCIGRNNYGYFFIFVGMMVLNLFFLQYILYHQWCVYGYTFTTVIGFLFSVILSLPLMHLFGIHCYLTCRNLTTNEMMNVHRYQYLQTTQGLYQNPFDKGIIRNVWERFVPDYMIKSSGFKPKVLEDEQDVAHAV